MEKDISNYSMSITGELPRYLPLDGSIKTITISEAIEVCEKSASNGMIYEAWLQSALENIYAISKALSEKDGIKLVETFKALHGIEDECGLASQAREALNDAYNDLYG